MINKPTMRSRLMLTTMSLSLMHGVACAGAETWASFQNGGAPSLEAAGRVALDWEPEANTAWSAELAGYGQSSPVTDGEVVYVTTVSGENKERLHLQAFELATGAQRWQMELANSTPEPNTTYFSRAAPTPVCDSTGVIAFFEGGNLVSVAADGQERWRRDLVEEYGPISARHGLAASLEQDDRRVFVWVERQEEPYVLAIDKQSGENLWKAPGVGATSWSSPRLAEVGGASHLLLSASGSVVGLDASTGEREWRLDGVTGNSAPSPMPLGAGRFLIGATDGRGESNSGASADSNGLVQISPTTDGYEADYVWRAKRATCSFGSPIVHRGLAYFVNRTGVVYCLDAESGQEQYAKRIVSSVWATPIGAGDHVYFFGKGGDTTVLKAGPNYEEVARNAAWESAPAAEQEAPAAGPPGFGGSVLYAAAVSDEKLLLRRGDRLICVTP